MRSLRTVLGSIVAIMAVGSAMAQETGALRWRAGAAPLGLHPAGSSLRVQCAPLSLGCESNVTLPLYESRSTPGSLSMQMGWTDVSPARKIPRPPGLSVSLVGRAAAVPDLGFYGRVGTTLPRSGLAPGGGEGGLSYGVGLSWDFSRSASAVLGWDSYDTRGLAGEARDVRATSLGLQWRY